MLALASPASLKGVLTPLEAARRRSPPACGASTGVEAVELPVADGGEGTADGARSRCSAASGTRRSSATRSAARSRRAGWCFRTALRSSSARRRVGLPRLAPDELDPLRASTPRRRRAAAGGARRAAGSRCSSVSAARRRVDGGAGMRAVVGTASAALPVSRSRATSATRCSASAARRASSGRRRARTERTSSELEARLAALAELVPFRDLPGAGAGGGLGAAFAALGGELVAGRRARARPDRVRRARRRRGARRHRRGNGRRDDARGQGAGRRCRGAARGSAFAASSSAASSATASRRTRSRVVPSERARPISNGSARS